MATLPGIALVLVVAVAESRAHATTTTTQVEERREYPKLSPFQGVRWNGDSPEVRVDDRWYGLTSIDGLATTAILRHCRAKYGSRAIKRFEEDLIEVLAGLGVEPSTTCDLELVVLEDGKAVKLADAAMTKANRDAIRRAADARGTEPAALPRVEREHASAPAPGFEDIGCRANGASRGEIPIETVAGDLDSLEWLIDNVYAYRALRSPDYRAALDAVRLAAREGTTLRDFAVDVAKVLARYGDGHSGIEGSSALYEAPYLPCLVEDAGKVLLAVRTDRSG